MGNLWRLLSLSLSLFLFLAGCEIDHGLAPPSPEPPEELGSISGTITYVGSWPDSVEDVRVAVYAQYPPPNFFAISGFSDSLPIGVPVADYSVKVKPGVYEWVIVVLLKKGSWWGPESLLGAYYAPSDTTRPGVVTVDPGAAVTGIDIIADFSRLGVLPPEVEGILKKKWGRVHIFLTPGM